MADEQPVPARLTFTGGAAAPIVTFDEVPFFGVVEGVGHVTIAARVLSHADERGGIPFEHVITAHLRASMKAMQSLRDTIDQLIMAALPAAGPQQ